MRSKAEGLPHDSSAPADTGHLIHIDVAAPTGHRVTVCGKTDVTRDLIDTARLPIPWESPVAGIELLIGVVGRRLKYNPAYRNA